MEEGMKPRRERQWKRPYTDCSNVLYRTFGVRLYGYEWEYLKKAAHSKGKTVSAYVRDRLSDVLEEARKERAVCSAG